MTRLRSPSASTPPCVSAIDAAADRIREETGLHTHAERRKLEWAADKQLGGTVILVLYLTFAMKLRSLLTPPPSPAVAASLLAYCAACLATIAWRRSGWTTSYMRWREGLATLLRLTACGLGAWTVLTGRLLEAVPPTAAAGAAAHLALIVFACGGPSCISHALAWRMRFWLSAATQTFLVGTILRHHPTFCSVPALASPAAQAHTHRLYSLLSTLAYTLPLPVSAFVQPDPEAECQTVLGFLHIAIGLLAPLVCEALAEARLFRQQQRRRRALGLPAERGIDASIFGAVGFLADEGSGLFVAAIVWVLLAVTWDWLALFSIPAEQRAWQGARG